MTQPHCIVLDERLTIAQAAALHRVFCDALAAGGPVAIDGTRVAEIDTAVLQLLCVLVRSATARGIACGWHGVSAALRRYAGSIGLTEILQFPRPDSQRVGDASG